jgi:hypothetical protein
MFVDIILDIIIKVSGGKQISEMEGGSYLELIAAFAG